MWRATISRPPLHLFIMTITNGYITLAEARAVIYPPNHASTHANARIEKTIEAASREIEKFCQRRFYSVPETRYYTPDDGYELTIDDLTGTPTIATDDDGDGTFETSWSAGDYLLKYGNNYNAALDGKPYTQIEVSESGTKNFPAGVKKSVRVYGSFGYIASTDAGNAPAPIHDACLITVHRLFKRHDLPLGVQGGGNPQLGQTPVVIPRITLDPDVQDLLKPYRRIV